MGFLDRLKQSQSAELEAWSTLDAVEQLDKIDALSEERPVAIFKHSTSCGISAGAKHRLESEWAHILDDLHLYYLDLLSYRPISNAIAKRYNIRHESPQILVIRNGEVIFHTSHHRINVGALKAAIEAT